MIRMGAHREERSPAADRAFQDLRRHPITAEAVTLAFEARQAERRRLAAEAARIRVEGAAELDRLRAELEAAREDLDRARAAVTAAVRRETDARAAIMLRSTLVGQRAAKCENLILAEAEPEITEARRRLQDMLAIRQDVAASTVPSGRNPVTGRLQYRETSMARSIAARREAMLQGLTLLDAMSREVHQTDIRTRIEEIFAALPEIESDTVTFDSPAPPRSERAGSNAALIAFTGA